MPGWTRWKGIMKCYPFETKRLEKWTPPYIIQPKYDGVRCRAVKLHTGGYLLLSSEENPIFSVPHINAALKERDFGALELDGELYCHGKSFEEIVSITSRSVNLHENYQSIQFHVFDYVSPEPQMERTIFMNSLEFHEPLILSPYWIAIDLTSLMEIYQELIAWGYEGIIVRHFANVYERKRSTMVMKFKPKQEDNYKIIGFEEEVAESGTPKGRLGALVCLSGDGNSFNVGTGFTHEMRKRLWESRDKLIGKVAKVQYQHITTGKKVPRFPVFVKVI